MDYDSLSDADVVNLVNTFKQYIENPIPMPPLVGDAKDDCVVEDSVNGIHYILHYYRGSIENKYSIHLRFTANNEHLVRLCINGSRHYNADGTYENGNHIHIYHYLVGGQKIESHVISLDGLPFGNPKTLSDDLEKFIQYVNIKSK